jgi:hypothetical protein
MLRSLARVAVCVLLAARVAGAVQETPSLERGYRLLYSFDFAGATREFQDWQRVHPDDPLGPAGEAASTLFTELDRAGILQSRFFLSPGSFAETRDAKPDPAGRARFDACAARAEAAARARLASASQDADAQFVLSSIANLQADYLALVEGRNMASLPYFRRAANSARALLAAAPAYADARVSTGISDYVIGSVGAPARWFLRLAGYAGDKAGGMRELALVAEKGRYLGPFARILMTLAYLREGNRAKARDLLGGLSTEFPSNQVFAREFERLSATK